MVYWIERLTAKQMRADTGLIPMSGYTIDCKVDIQSFPAERLILEG